MAVFKHSPWSWSWRLPARHRGPRPPTGLPLNSAPFLSQEKNQRATHLTGAFFAFFVGIFYFWLQLLLFWRVKSLPQPGAPWIGPLRLVLCSICTILTVASILPGAGDRCWRHVFIGVGLLCAIEGAPSFLSLGLRAGL